MQDMIRYLVGGAVRDRLLQRPIKDLDWLVTGTSPAELIALGYRKVGKAFPTYLHPKTNEEYSFPRGPTQSEDTLSAIHDDLMRRDLTINAMALGTDGTLIDPLSGEKDLKQRLLRHTPAFTEDPLRIIRTARLLADLSPQSFSIAPETKQLMQIEVARGVLQPISKERIWSEIERALLGNSPVLFFQTLREVGVLSAILPELEQLFGIPQPPEHHPEIDCGEHALLALAAACELTDNPCVRFAALIHDLGKGITPQSEWPSHRGHEHHGLPLVEQLCLRVGAPKAFTVLSLQVCELHTKCHQALNLKPGTLLRLFQKTDCFRKSKRFSQFLVACEADAKGRSGYQDTPYPQREYLESLANNVRHVDFSLLNLSEKSTTQRVQAINHARLDSISRKKRDLLKSMSEAEK